LAKRRLAGHASHIQHFVVEAFSRCVYLVLASFNLLYRIDTAYCLKLRAV
jgi:hypothetical protein